MTGVVIEIFIRRPPVGRVLDRAGRTARPNGGRWDRRQLGLDRFGRGLFEGLLRQGSRLARGGYVGGWLHL